MKSDSDEAIAAWNKRLFSRRHLSDYDLLQKGDALWFEGDWREIPPSQVGLLVLDTEGIYGVRPRPTFGRMKS